MQAEAFQNFDFLLRPQQSPPRTPSLASDDSHSHDSPSVSTPRNLTKDLSLSPKLVSGVAQASLESNEYYEADVALPVRLMDIDSTNNSDIVQSSTLHNVFQMDVTKCVESPIALETSMPPSGAPPRLQRSRQKLESTFSRRAMPKLTNMPPTVLVAKTVKSCTEQDNLIDDAYLPELEPSTNSSEIRIRTKKHSKSSTFKCPQCPQRFTRNFDRQRHMKTIHVIQTTETIIAHTCTCCGAQLSRKDAFKRHIEKIPKSCFTMAKRNQTPEPLLSKEAYAIRKIQMMEVLCTRQS